MEFDEFEEEYDDLVHSISSSGCQTYEIRLNDWFSFLDSSPISSSRIKKLEASFDFHEWYSKGKESVGGMVGSGELQWATDRTHRLAQLLDLFRHFSVEEGAFIDFSTKFFFAGTRYDDMVLKINVELFEPFSRDLLRDIRRHIDDDVLDDANYRPGQIAILDHSRKEYDKVIESLRRIEVEVKKSNEIGSDIPEEKERLLAEISAGRRLLEAVHVRIDAVKSVLVAALQWLAEHYANAIVGVLAAATLGAIASLLGIEIPGQ